jgi:hypothetical protein
MFSRAKVITLLIVKLGHYVPHVMFAGMMATYLSGLNFFDGPVDTSSFAEILEVFVILQLRDRGHMEGVCLQYSGALECIAQNVQDILTFKSLTVTLHMTRFNIKKFYVVPTLCLCVLYGSQNKQQLLPYKTLTDWFL